jgi:hypothetical protein
VDGAGERDAAQRASDAALGKEYGTGCDGHGMTKKYMYPPIRAILFR